MSQKAFPAGPPDPPERFRAGSGIFPMDQPPVRRQAGRMNSAVASPLAQIIDSADALRRMLRGRRARSVAYAFLLTELALVIGFAIAYRPFDLNIYLWGGRAVTQGTRLYLVQAHANWFTYPPFAAAVFTPLAALPTVVVVLAWELASVAAFAWSCVLSLKLAGWHPSKAVVAAVVGAGLPAGARVSHAVPGSGQRDPAGPGDDRCLAVRPRTGRRSRASAWPPRSS